MDLIEKNPYKKYKVPLAETNRDFLTATELNAIQDKEIKIKRLEAIRDIFVFACYTGLSYSYIVKLHRDHLRKGIDKTIGFLLTGQKRIIVAEYQYSQKQRLFWTNIKTLLNLK